METPSYKYNKSFYLQRSAYQFFFILFKFNDFEDFKILSMILLCILINIIIVTLNTLQNSYAFENPNLNTYKMYLSSLLKLF